MNSSILFMSGLINIYALSFQTLKIHTFAHLYLAKKKPLLWDKDGKFLYQMVTGHYHWRTYPCCANASRNVFFFRQVGHSKCSVHLFLVVSHN